MATRVPVTLVGEPKHTTEDWVFELVCECGVTIRMRVPFQQGRNITVQHGEGEAYREFAWDEWRGLECIPVSDWVESLHDYERIKAASTRREYAEVQTALVMRDLDRRA